MYNIEGGNVFVCQIAMITRVAEIAEVDLNKYDKISNPVYGKSINLQISDREKRIENEVNRISGQVGGRPFLRAR